MTRSCGVSSVIPAKAGIQDIRSFIHITIAQFRHYILFDILNLSHALRRRLRRVLEFVCYLGFAIWNFQFFQILTPIFVNDSQFCYLAG